jgi:hypothetical protein
MKKFLILFLCFFGLVLTGCAMGNTPTSKVEAFLDSYTSGSDTVLKQLKEMVDSDAMMDDAQRTTYSDIMKKQYKDMTYDIKNETIDGDNATVTAEIEVYDYYRSNQESQNYFDANRDQFKEDGADKSNNISNSKFIDYRLSQLQNVSDRIKYTIDFTLKKVDDKWVLDEVDDATRQKIHGLFEH